MRLTGSVLATLVVACTGRTVASTAEEDGSEGNAASEDATGSSGRASTSSTSSDTGSSTSSSTSTTSTGFETLAETGEVPTCVEGTWDGLWSSGYDWAAFQPCGSSESWWFAGPIACAEAWITIEGTVCGPGGFGHLGQYDYEFTGVILEACLVGGCDEPGSSCGEPDELCGWIECDPVSSDCMRGEKCVPHGPDTGPWNGTECVPGVPMPIGEGDACVWSAAGGDCDEGLHCAIVDPDAGTGVCVPYCVVGGMGCPQCDPCGGVAPGDYFGLCFPECMGPDPCPSC